MKTMFKLIDDFIYELNVDPDNVIEIRNDLLIHLALSGFRLVAVKPSSKAITAGIDAYEDAMGGQRLPDGEGYDREVITKIFEAMVSV